MSKRTYHEQPWFKASQQGATILIQFYADKKQDIWWPLIFLELDTGCAKIDVCGLSQNIHMSDCARLKILETNEIVEFENFETTETE